MDFRRTRIAGTIIAIAIVLVLGAHALRHHARAPVKAGDRVPALQVVDLSGAPVTLNPGRGVVVYNVFTTWCPSCKEETPAFARAAERLRSRGVQVVGIDQGEGAQAISSFADRFRMRYPIVIDTTHVTNAVLGARVIPQTVVVKDGIVKAIAVGPITPDELDRMIGAV